MRRWICCLMAALILLLSVSALAASLNAELIDDAKQALTLMSYGEYKKALKKLNLKKDVGASELSDFVDENLSDLYFVSVQTDVAVAYQLDGAWRVAIPIETPSYDSVQTLVLRARDAKRFDAYKAMTWYEVLDEANAADEVIWRDAYEKGELYLLPDE